MRVRALRSLVLGSWVLGLLPGCPTPPPPVPTDAPRDGGADVPFDAFGMDVPTMDAPIDTFGLDVPGLDVPGLDAPMADDVPTDVPGLDAPRPDAPIDAGPLADVPPPDGGGCVLPDGGLDACVCSVHEEPCAAGVCGDEGAICLSDGCGMVCAGRGASCESAADCPTGSLCKFNGTGRSCTRFSGCVDSRDCPSGHACLAGTCSDRRIGCGGPDGVADCPINFFCDASTGPPHCVRVVRGCDVSGACPLGGVCSDVEGDGDRECVALGMCDSNTDCPARSTCEIDPVRIAASCGTHGLCRTAGDCQAGQLCQDLWGDGILECVDAGGTCGSTAACPGSGICATPSEGGAPRCIARAFPL